MDVNQSDPVFASKTENRFYFFGNLFSNLYILSLLSRKLQISMKASKTENLFVN